MKAYDNGKCKKNTLLLATWYFIYIKYDYLVLYILINIWNKYFTYII